MLRRVFSQFRLRNSKRTTARRPQPHRFRGGAGRSLFAEQLEARWYLAADPIVQVNTNLGSFQIDLNPAAAPKSVANFLDYVDSGRYNDAIVSRSIANFVIQAGGITSTSATYSSNSQFVPVPQDPAIPLEYGIPNTVGTIAMARSSSPTSATDEWFINLTDNSKNLGPGGVDPNGYSVFGTVVGNGMQVVNSIAAVPTQNKGSVSTSATSSTDLNNLPIGANNQLVQITSMTLLDGVSGTVFNDANANGQQDSGEAGVAGRTVFVDVDGTGQPDANNPSAVTDANGNYVIFGVTAGSFKVREVLPGGLGLTTPIQTVTFATSQAASHVNFGEGASITGTVFTDLNNDGNFDAGDPGVAGRTVFLNNDGSGHPDASNPSTTTDASGKFFFVGLAAGTYKVAEVQPANVTLTTNTQAIVVSATQTSAAVANIGELPSIVGTVFNDLNVNGQFDSGEPGIAGVTVFLNVDNTGQPDSSNPSVTTDANGRFAFTGVAPGSYTVLQVLTPNHGVTQTLASTAVTVTDTSAPPIVNLGDVLTSTIAPFPIGMNTGTPPTNANAAFIDNLYFTLLGHHADATSLSYWQQQMAGGASRSTVVETIWNSPEHRGDEVDQFYHTFLDRNAELAGRDYWINTFSIWNNEKILALNFVTVPEYQSLHSSSASYVTALYNDIALRPADSAGLTFWENALANGESRLQVAQAFINGQEASTRLVDSFYADFLHRTADPTTAGMVTNFEQNKVPVETAAISVLASDEYFSLSGKV